METSSTVIENVTLHDLERVARDQYGVPTDEPFQITIKKEVLAEDDFSPEAKNKILEGVAELDNGEFDTFNTMDDLIADLDE